jgi:hypothetical protein
MTPAPVVAVRPLPGELGAVEIDGLRPDDATDPANELPSTPGGATHFVDMRAAYRFLEPDRRAQLLGLRAAYSYNNRGAFPPRVSAEGPFEQLVDVAHPIVRAHPVTGGASLYIDLDRATHVEGIPEIEGRALLQSLQDHAEAHAPRYAHAWRPHDILVWDNASVQHKAGGDFPVGEPRRFWRAGTRCLRRRAMIEAKNVEHFAVDADAERRHCSRSPAARDRDHDIAELLVRLHVPVRVDDLGEPIGAVDDRRELPRLDEALDVLDHRPVDPWDGKQHPSSA